MPTAFTASLRLVVGQTDGSPNDQIDVLVPSTYDVSVDQILSYTGSATETIGLGTLPTTAKLLLVQYLTDNNPVTDVNLLVNGAVAGGTPIKPGGFMLCALSGVTALSLVHTAACKVRIIALG